MLLFFGRRPSSWSAVTQFNCFSAPFLWLQNIESDVANLSCSTWPQLQSGCKERKKEKKSKRWHVKWPCSLWICEEDCGGGVKLHSWGAGEPAVPVRHWQHSLHVCGKISQRSEQNAHTHTRTQSLFPLTPFHERSSAMFWCLSYQRFWCSALFVNVTLLLWVPQESCFTSDYTHTLICLGIPGTKTQREKERENTDDAPEHREAWPGQPELQTQTLLLEENKVLFFCTAAPSPPFNCAKIAESIAGWPHGDCLVVFSNSLSSLPTEQILQDKKTSVKSPLEASESCGLKPLLEQCL